MERGKRRTLALLALGMLIALTALSRGPDALAIIFEAPLKLVNRTGVVSPGDLSSTQPSPVALRMSVSVSTVDGGYPPALERLDTSIDRQLRIGPPAVPACGYTPSRQPSFLSRDCRESIVGLGNLRILVAYPESEPFEAEAKLTVYYGGHPHGETILWIDGVFPSPASNRLTLPMAIRKVRGPRYGLETTLSIPKLLNGHGLVTHLGLSLHPGLFSATCSPLLQFRSTMAFRNGVKQATGTMQRC